MTPMTPNVTPVTPNAPLRTPSEPWMTQVPKVVLDQELHVLQCLKIRMYVKSSDLEKIRAADARAYIMTPSRTTGRRPIESESGGKMKLEITIPMK